ncbi:hypothetical protein OAS39_00280 [Pirellulales bacterium]|nr:hypothetical protein [Pirellulales bacterium]
MPIRVICPGCHTRFKVGDQHAGKTGACPKCKQPIEIPTADDEVVIHTPEMEEGAKTASGRSVLKPIARKETKFKVNATIAIVGGAVLASAIAYLAGQSDLGYSLIYVLGVGALLLGPPLAYAAYSFLKDDELASYEGAAVWIRAAACGSVYALLWGVYVFVAGQLFGSDFAEQGLEMVYVAGLAGGIAAIGTFAAFVSFDLEPLTGFFHYAFYLVVTAMLRAVMGLDFLPGLSLGG